MSTLAERRKRVPKIVAEKQLRGKGPMKQNLANLQLPVHRKGA